MGHRSQKCRVFGTIWEASRFLGVSASTSAGTSSSLEGEDCYVRQKDPTPGCSKVDGHLPASPFVTSINPQPQPSLSLLNFSADEVYLTSYDKIKSKNL